MIHPCGSASCDSLRFDIISTHPSVVLGTEHCRSPSIHTTPSLLVVRYNSLCFALGLQSYTLSPYPWLSSSSPSFSSPALRQPPPGGSSTPPSYYYPTTATSHRRRSRHRLLACCLLRNCNYTCFHFCRGASSREQVSQADNPNHPRHLYIRHHSVPTGSSGDGLALRAKHPTAPLHLFP